VNEQDLQFLKDLVERYGRGREGTIPILQAIQKRFRYLPQEALKYICENTEITPALITGVATFYTQFRLAPVGKYLIHVCHGTACHVKGAGLVQQALEQHLGLREGTDTTQDGLFTVQKVACLGCCTLAPVVQIEDVTYGHVVPDMVPRILRDFLTLQRGRREEKKRRRPEAADGQAEIRIGLGSCCQARGSARVFQAFEDELRALGVKAKVKRVGCVGMCHQTPLVEIVPPGGPSTTYALVKPEDAHAIVRRHFKPRGPRKLTAAFSKFLDGLLFEDSAAPLVKYPLDPRDPPVVSFLGPQLHIATEHCGVLDPLDLEDYTAREGFQALKKVLGGMSPMQVIAEVKHSGLRGRGGAGYPTGTKWEQVRLVPSDIKYVICNGDEGDPGAFMDRMLLESYPYRIIEGMIIAAYAVGAHEGIFYIRAEYPLAVQRIREAIRRCEEAGLAGENILGSGFSFHLRIMEGAGAFVCGEETALIASLEGRRGMPRLRPPYPAEKGLWGKPTLVNNTETFALVPWIIRHGGDSFRAIGTPRSAGTKVFALAGKVRRGGLIEVPMGITILQIVEDIGGGAVEGRRFKAVQIGGPSGGCIPARLADTPVDYDSLTAVGAIMGSGGLVVLDDRDCMVDIARYFLQFTQNQSCGKCTFCRIGTKRMLEILDRIVEGKGKEADLADLEELALQVKQGSLCGLGKTAPNPVLTTLKYFREEYQAHLEGWCPAKHCKALIEYFINDRCIGCTICAQHCPVEAIPMTPYQQHTIDTERCVRCDTCRTVCPVEAVEIRSEPKNKSAAGLSIPAGGNHAAPHN